MTIFGVIWIACVILCFFHKNIKYMLALTLLFMTFQCTNIIEIFGRGIGPQILTSLAFIIKCMIESKAKLSVRKNTYGLMFAIAFMLGCVFFSCLKNDNLSNASLHILQLTIYVTCFICILQQSKRLDVKSVYHIILYITIFQLITSILQLLTTIGILPLRPILKILFYNDNDIVSYFNRSYYSRMLGTFMEPSYYSAFLVGAFFYFISIGKKLTTNLFLIGAIFLELLFTTSSTGYGAFLVVLFVFVLFNTKLNFKWKISIVICGVVGFMFLYIGFYDVLDRVIFSKTASGSYAARASWNNAAWNNYLSSKWFGIGFKNSRASSIVYTLLAETGIIGFAAYAYFNLKIFLPVLHSKRSKKCCDEFDIGVRFAVLAAVVCQIIGCPDLSLCSYWFWLYCFALNYNKISDKCFIKQGIQEKQTLTKII